MAALQRAVVIVAVLCGVSWAGGISYKRYINVRFAYGISYPAGVLIPQGEADNGDGQKFVSKDKRVEMLAYGSTNADLMDEMDVVTIRAIHARDLAFAKEDHPDRRITYQRFGKDWYVVSGFEGGKVFYSKVMKRKDDSDSVTFYISYPKSSAGKYDPIVAAISKSMKLLKGPYTVR
jgi:hypothetical protein